MNKNHSLLHRVFLISMFCLCAVAVVLLVKKQTDSALAEGISLNNITTLNLINGACYEEKGTIVKTVPIMTNLCKTGIPSPVIEKNTDGALGWAWRCTGLNNGTSTYCNVTKYIEKEIIEPPKEESPALAVKIEPEPANPQSLQDTTTIENTNATTANGSSVIVTENRESSNANEDDNNDNDISKNATNPSIETVVKSGQVAPPVENLAVTNQQEEKVVTKAPVAEKSLIIAESVIIKAENLAQDNNPKIAGTSSDSLKIEKVELKKNEDGKNNVKLAGKAQPNALVTVYIFSKDPIVITIKADAEGNWSYELDKELDDGQHEAYVAVTDSVGKIISKSEPIAFVKTAQAASEIPISELVGNQSPIEKSSQQYILIAIMIMFIFLAGSLALIGYLTHKKNLDEGIN